MQSPLWLILLFLLPLPLLRAQPGCPDPLALNYDPAATSNDGSCLYADSLLRPVISLPLADSLRETSGLALWQEHLWTHNDDSDRRLFALDTATAQVAQLVALPGVTNRDWEALAQDSAYFYLADCGNNASGNRQDLRILRLAKASLLSGSPQIDTLAFAYANQSDFSAQPANQSDFDCEALVAGRDSLYLFTKQWLSRQTAIYALPKLPGAYLLTPRDTFDVKGLITGASWLESERLLLLAGYTPLLEPFLYLCYDFAGDDFFGGNKRRIRLDLGFHQVEGIAMGDGTTVFLTNERFSQPPFVDIPPQLHRLDLRALLGPYLGSTTQRETPRTWTIELYPQPAVAYVWVAAAVKALPLAYRLFDGQGKTWQQGEIEQTRQRLAVEGLPAGLYFLELGGKRGKVTRHLLKN